MISRTIAILIASRGREDYLARLISDMDAGFMPALEAGGLGVVTFVYAQGYPRAYIATLAERHAAAIAAGRLVLCEAEPQHRTIGEVAAAAAARMGERIDYRLAMVMDDDSLYRPSPEIDANLRAAAGRFLAGDFRAFSIKLGPARALEYRPFVDSAGPIMPFKEKMLWLSRAVVEEALALPGFATLSIGEDAVLAALAWRGGAQRCLGVHGIATFLHLAFEPDDVAHGAITGGYGELVGYVEGQASNADLGKYEKALTTGTTPWHILPEIFVGPDHPHFAFNGIRAEAVAKCDRPAPAD